MSVFWLLLTRRYMFNYVGSLSFPKQNIVSEILWKNEIWCSRCSADDYTEWYRILSQIKQAINSAGSSVDKSDLFSLEKDIEELISLTKENLVNIKPISASTEDQPACALKEDPFLDEYALFKAELAELEGDSADENENERLTGNSSGSLERTVISQDLQDDLESLKGSKCQAPHKQQWGDVSYHNALIMDFETKEQVENMNHIQVRVMYVNPTERDMLPCPYYLDGECRFSNERCRFSHGELVPLSDIREYREPEFSLIKEGTQVFAKQKDNLWHRAKVKEILNNSRCLVKFESKGCETVELDLHDLLPLEGRSEDESESRYCSSSGSDSEEEELPQDYFVQMSLLRTPAGLPLGAWEKHTKGIGSRLMASMGYVVGCGLGKRGEGRLEPVEAMAYPPGKSLDACMALREAAGGDQDMFKADQLQKRQQRRLLRLQQRQERRSAHKLHNRDVFSFINTKLSGAASTLKTEKTTTTSLASSSRKGLNVERFHLGENIKKVEKAVEKYKQSLKRHENGSVTHNTIKVKLEEAKSELNRLQDIDKLVVREQHQRDGRKKLSVF